MTTNNIGPAALFVSCCIVVWWLHSPAWKAKQRAKQEKRDEETYGKLH